jgi:2-alkyl-3-oxoalkanoate reductase
VGHRVCDVLVRRGFDVRGLVRPEDDTQRLDLDSVKLRLGYIQDTGCVRAAMKGADVVIHCAGLLPDAEHATPSDFHEVNVEGTRNVLQQAIACRTRWVIAMSTISVVDHVSRTITPDALFEYTSNASRDPYLASKIDAERLLLEERRRYDGELAILRLAYVYGPGNFAVWCRPLRFLANGTFRLIGSGDVPFPLIYADDIAHYILALLDTRMAGGYDGIHILANPQSTTLRAVFDELADGLHVPRPGTVPLWMAQVGALVVRAVPRRLRSGRIAMLTPARVQQFSRGYDLSAVLNREQLERVGMMDYREGLRSMLADYCAVEQRVTST